MSTDKTAESKTQYAVHKTLKQAYKRVGDADWEPIALEEVPTSVEKAGHEKIGAKWFTLVS